MTVSTEEKYKALLDVLWARTANNQLQWEDASENDTFLTRLPPFIIRLSVIEQEEVDFYLQIFDGAGALVDYFTDVTLKRLRPADTRFHSYFSLMKEMHRLAGRHVSGAERVLDSILEGLGINPSAVEQPTEDLTF